MLTQLYEFGIQYLWPSECWHIGLWQATANFKFVCILCPNHQLYWGDLDVDVDMFEDIILRLINVADVVIVTFAVSSLPGVDEYFATAARESS